MNHSYKLSLFTISILLSTSTTIYADEHYHLDTAVISASGYNQELVDAPATISIVSQEELENKPVRDLGEAVDDLPGVEVSKSKVGSSQIKIRGFDSKYTAILIDGKRQNASDGIISNGFDPNGAFMPPTNTIERIEVIRGPASVLYGSDAIGGVINIITKKHVDEFTGSVGLETLLQEEHKKYGNAFGLSGNMSIPVINNKLSLSLHGKNYNKDASNLRKPDGSYASHSNGDYQNYNYGTRVNYNINDDHFIYVDYEHSFESGSVNSTSNKAIRSQKDWARNHALINYDGTYSFGDVNSYAQFINTKQVGSKASGSNGQGGLQKQPYGRLESQNYIFQSSVVTPFDFGSYGALSLNSGFNFDHERLYDEDNMQAKNGKALQNITALFTEGEYFFTDNFSTVLGARYTYGNIFGSHLNPRAYLVYKPTDGITLKGGIAAGYKIPNLKQITPGMIQYETSTDGQSEYKTYGNENLKPEKSINYELSAIFERQNVGSLTLTAFYTTFTDKLSEEQFANGETLSFGGKCSVTGNDGYCLQYINVDESNAYGLEALLSTAKFYDFNLNLNYTYTQTEITSGPDKGKPLSETPRHSLGAKLNYNYQDFNAYVKLTAKYRTPVTNTKTSPNLNYYKSYELVDVGFNYTLNKVHHFAFVIGNIFNTDYDTYKTSLIAGGKEQYAAEYNDYIEGRNYWLSYKMDF